MWGVLQKVWRSLFPLSVDSVKLLHEFRQLDIDARVEDKSGVKVISLFDYKNPAVRQAILKLKYKGLDEFAEAFADKLKDFLIAENTENEFWGNPDIVLVPIPMHKVRKKKKSFNPPELVLKYLKKDFNVDTSILKRVKFTQTQKGKNKKERTQNVSGAFAAKYNGKYKNSHIFIVDDVSASGATLKSAKQALKKAGYKHIVCLALASRKTF